MVSWAEFAGAVPDFAAAGRRLLVGDDGVAIGFLATGGFAVPPHLSPVCPIFCGDHLYVSASARTAKVRDLRDSGTYALHAFLGQNDEEFQIRGSVQEVTNSPERWAVHEAIPFPSFDADDPIFRLDVRGCLWVSWERVGEPGTKALRRRWPELGAGPAEPADTAVS